MKEYFYGFEKKMKDGNEKKNVFWDYGYHMMWGHITPCDKWYVVGLNHIHFEYLTKSI
jgi:hypothetical protein